MILLDTNLISETMKPNPNPGVMEWLNQQDLGSLWLPVIVVMELRFGAALLASGPRNHLRVIAHTLSLGAPMAPSRLSESCHAAAP